MHVPKTERERSFGAVAFQVKTDDKRSFAHVSQKTAFGVTRHRARFSARRETLAVQHLRQPPLFAAVPMKGGSFLPKEPASTLAFHYY